MAEDFRDEGAGSFAASVPLIGASNGTLYEGILEHSALLVQGHWNRLVLKARSLQTQGKGRGVLPITVVIEGTPRSLLPDSD